MKSWLHALLRRQVAGLWLAQPEGKEKETRSLIYSLFLSYYKGLGIITTETRPCLLFKVVLELSVTQEWSTKSQVCWSLHQSHWPHTKGLREWDKPSGHTDSWMKYQTGARPVLGTLYEFVQIALTTFRREALINTVCKWKKKKRLEGISNLSMVYDRARTWCLSAPSLAVITAFLKM